MRTNGVYRIKAFNNQTKSKALGSRHGNMRKAKKISLMFIRIIFSMYLVSRHFYSVEKESELVYEVICIQFCKTTSIDFFWDSKQQFKAGGKGYYKLGTTCMRQCNMKVNRNVLAL